MYINYNEGVVPVLAREENLKKSLLSLLQTTD